MALFKNKGFHVEISPISTGREAYLLFPGMPIWCNLEPMNAVLSPIESEFATTEEAEAYDRWFRAQVQEAIADPRPSIPHDQVMAEMRALIAEKRKIARSKSKS